MFRKVLPKLRFISLHPRLPLILEMLVTPGCGKIPVPVLKKLHAIIKATPIRTLRHGSVVDPMPGSLCVVEKGTSSNEGSCEVLGRTGAALIVLQKGGWVMDRMVRVCSSECKLLEFGSHAVEEIKRNLAGWRKGMEARLNMLQLFCEQKEKTCRTTSPRKTNLRSEITALKQMYQIEKLKQNSKDDVSNRLQNQKH